MTDIRTIADRVKRQTRHPDVLALCDAVLQMVAKPKPKRDRAAYMRRYRASKKTMMIDGKRD